MVRPTSSAERLGVLHGTVSELALHVATADLTRLYTVVVDGARALTGAVLAVALSWDAVRRTLVLEASGRDGDAAPGPSMAELAACASPAFSSRTTLITDDLEDHPRVAAMARRLGLGTGAALPIPRPGEGPPLGVLFIAHLRGEATLVPEDARLLELFAAYAGIALTHAASVAGAVRRVARVEQLTSSLRALTEARERDLILERGLDCALGVLGADRAAVFLTNSREELAFCAARGLSRAYLEMVGSRYRQSVGGLVPLARAPVYVSDLQTDPRTRVIHDLAAQEGVHSVLFVPLLTASRLLGAVALYHDLLWPYDPEDIAHARALADELAAALASSALQESTQRELARQRALNRVAHQLLEGAALRRAMQILVDDGVASAVWLWGSSLSPLADAGASELLGEEAAAVARAVIDGGRVATRATPWGSVAASPLRRGGQVIGVIAVADRRRPRIDPPAPSLHLVVSDESDVSETQELVTGAALLLGAALGRLAGGGREPQARAGGKP